MPTRKRRTHLRVVKHPEPTLPEGNEGSQMTAGQRKDKLDLFLRDFDMEVEERVDALNKQYENICRAIDNTYRMAIIRLPKNIRDMTMKEFLEKGGSVSTVNEVKIAEASKIATTHGQRLLSNITNSANSTAKRTVVTKGKIVMETVAEEPENQTAGKYSTVKTTTIKRKKIVRKKAIAAQTPVRRSARKRSASANASLSTAAGRSSSRKNTKLSHFVTPANRAPLNPAGWDTPAITPKFDPRLPFTPATSRKPKLNECLMSLDGSPVYSQLNIQIPVGGGKTIPVNLDESVNADQVDVSETTRQNILLLQKKLNKILQKPAVGSSQTQSD